MPLQNPGQRFFALLGLTLALTLIWVGGAFAIPKGDARFVVDAYTGEVLVARGSLTTWHPASLTKMMTLYLLFDAVQRGHTTMDAPIILSRHAANQPPSRLGLGQGGRILVRDAIQSLAVKSANDVAVAVAEHVAGSEAKFARRMTQTAKRLGMRRTVFANASGLHKAQQVTTARDMAILAVALVRDFPQHYRYFSQARFRYGERTYSNTNHMLGVYDGMDGIKTGYIYKSGFNLVTSVKRDGRRIVGVVMGANTSAARTKLMQSILDDAFERLEQPRRKRITSPLPVRLRKPPPLPRSRPASLNGQAPLLASAASAPAVVSTADDSPAQASNAGDYSVQVGAFRRKRDANRRLTAVMSRLPPRLGDPDVVVKSSRNFYLARLVGFDSRQEAASACHWLKQRKTECLVLASSQ